MEREPTYPLLVGRGFLATTSAVINCKKAKIAVGERATRSIFGVKEIDFEDEHVPYWTTIRKRKSYAPRTSADRIGLRPPSMQENTFGKTTYPRNGRLLETPKSTPLKTS
uniref:Uncharacterized protein n=1 Tax=Tanacetum cinerariifolium TaxID=118510 RepID=A0A699JUN4_TANCI|nr:hypothetical protein [Tanacetum cinerariifolium]